MGVPMNGFRQFVEARGGGVKRVHYSRFEELAPRDTPQVGSSDKPSGIWYACDERWELFVAQGEMYGKDDPDSFYNRRKPTMEHKFLLTLDMSKMLVLDSEYKVENFTHTYVDRSMSRYNLIDWKRVAERYSGVECCPYFRELREYYMWYVGWDVPSGCVWDAGAVQKVEKLSQPPFPDRRW